MKTEKTQEQLYNRILINFGIGILAYALLYFLYQKLYMKNWITFTLAGIFIAAAVVFYAMSGKKPLKNYAHMFLIFGSGAALYKTFGHSCNGCRNGKVHCIAGYLLGKEIAPDTN